MMGLWWDLGTTVLCRANQLIRGNITIENPSEGYVDTFDTYLWGCLFDAGGNLIDGTLFALLWNGSLGYAEAVFRTPLPSPTIWTVSPTIPTRTIPIGLEFDRTDVFLAMFWHEKRGGGIDPDEDSQLGALVTALSEPPSQIEQLMPLIGAVLAIGVMGAMVRSMTK